jgi:outer membrane receptor for monomeric catechols
MLPTASASWLRRPRTRSAKGWNRRGLPLILLFLAPLLAWAEDKPAKIDFDLPKGGAEVTLKLFVQQSGEEIIYLVDPVRGVQTSPVKGRLTAYEALRRMLAGTTLSAAKDATTGALAVTVRSATLARLRELPSGREIVKLSPFQVSSDAYSGYVASRTFSGGKTVMNLNDVPQTLHVVTSDLIVDTGAIDPNEVLNKIVPGVSSFAGPSGVNAVIRGFRAQNWAVDGATTRYLGMITNFNFEAFEVIKGPASVTFGPFAAYGGYINMVPKNAHRGLLNKVEASVGTDNFYSGMIDVGGESAGEGNLQYRLVAGFVDADRPGWNWDYNHVQLLAPSFAYDFNDRSRLTVRFEFSRAAQRLSTTALDATGRLVEEFSSNGPPLPGMDRHTTDNVRLAHAVFTSRITPELSTRFNVMVGQGEKNYNTLSLYGQAAATDYLIAPFQADYEWKTLYVDCALSWERTDIGGSGIDNQLVGSVSLDHWDIDYVIFDGTLIDTVNTLRVNPAAPDWNALLYKFEYPTRYIPYNTEWLGGAVVEDRVGLYDGKLQLSAALRWNYDNRSYYVRWRTPQNQNPGGIYLGNPVPAIIYQKPTFRYGLVYKPRDRVALYAGYTEAYLAVGAIYKANGSQLVPETGSNREVGLKLDLVKAFGGTFSGNVALFEVEVQNKWRGDPNNAGFFIQDGVQINRGAEAQLTFTSERVSGLIGAFKADGPNEQGTGLRAVTNPDTTFNFWLKYNVTKRLSIGGGYRYVGDTISNNRLYRSEPFGTGDLFISYTHPLTRGAVSYRLGVTNLTDELAVYRIDSAASIAREDGRRVKLTATYTW